MPAVFRRGFRGLPDAGLRPKAALQTDFSALWEGGFLLQY